MNSRFQVTLFCGFAFAMTVGCKTESGEKPNSIPKNSPPPKVAVPDDWKKVILPETKTIVYFPTEPRRRETGSEALEDYLHRLELLDSNSSDSVFRAAEIKLKAEFDELEDGLKQYVEEFMSRLIEIQHGVSSYDIRKDPEQLFKKMEFRNEGESRLAEIDVVVRDGRFKARIYLTSTHIVSLTAGSNPKAAKVEADLTDLFLKSAMIENQDAD